MVRYDCQDCGENVFDVVDVEHLDTLPRTWVCSGCGREYTGERDEEGRLIVYLKGFEETARVYEETRLTPIESEPGEDDQTSEPAEDEQTSRLGEDEQAPDPGESAQASAEEPPEPGESAEEV